jgi:hypothetical protein
MRCDAWHFIIIACVARRSSLGLGYDVNQDKKKVKRVSLALLSLVFSLWESKSPTLGVAQLLCVCGTQADSGVISSHRNKAEARGLCI